MLSKAEQASFNLEEARSLRAQGLSYRAIRRRMAISPAQLGHIRRALKREKAARTRLAKKAPMASDRELPVAQSVLPPGLRRSLAAAGLHTLGDVADRVADADRPGLQALPGVGPHKARLVMALLEHFALLPECGDLQASIESLFPEFGAD